MNLTEHLLEQSVIDRQAKRGFWEHSRVNVKARLVAKFVKKWYIEYIYIPITHTVESVSAHFT